MADRHFDLRIIMFSSKILKQADFQIFKNGSTQVLSSTGREHVTSHVHSVDGEIQAWPVYYKYSSSVYGLL